MNALFEEIGYESTNFVLQFGSLFFILAFLIIFNLLRCGLKKITTNMKENKFVNFLRKKVYYNE